MRPQAVDTLLKDLDDKYGLLEYDFPSNCCIRPLTLSDLDQVHELEKLGFSESEQASKQSIEYRLKACPELCCGVFIREFNFEPSNSLNSSSTNVDDSDVDYSNAVATKASTLANEKLIGHILATKTANEHVQESDMEIGGHLEDGKTIAIHSVVIHPEWRGKHIGHIMVRDHVEKFYSLFTAERMSLLCQPDKVSFYEKNGFRNLGQSDCKHGGKEWLNMVLPFDSYDNEEEYN